MKPLCVLVPTMTLFFIQGAEALAQGPLLTIDTPMSPPAWALLERSLLQANASACKEFYS
jgi:hypothetical protein